MRSIQLGPVNASMKPQWPPYGVTVNCSDGGRVIFPKTIEDIIPLYEQIGRELGTSYSLGYLSSDSRTDGSFRRIEVRVRDGGLRTFQSRMGYYAK